MRKGTVLGWLVAVLMTFGWPALGLSNTITVNSLNDPSDMGFCTLHDAIVAANAANNTTVNGCGGGNGNDTINFVVSSTIPLAGSLPAITHTLTIDGTGQSITIDGGGAHQILSMGSGSILTLNQLTFSNGKANFGAAVANFSGAMLTVTNCAFNTNIASSEGGAIYAQNAPLSISNSSFTGNSIPSSGEGGAIYFSSGHTMNDSTGFKVVDSTFTSSFAFEGGAIAAIGGDSQTVTGCSFNMNHATLGGAIAVVGQQLSVSASTFSKNTSNFGGGIFNATSTLTVLNSTFSGNDGGSTGGGAIYNSNGGSPKPTLKMTNCTVVGNTAAANKGGGILNDYTATLNNTILAQNGSGGNCAGATAIVDGGYNISDDATCGFSGTSVNSTDPKVGTLQNNGGRTETIALMHGSPAIDAIPFASCVDQASPTPNQIAIDQRGQPRPDPGDGDNGPCDIGAYEIQDAQGITGVVTHATAASLLLPYFEVDLNNNTPAADTTVLSITNTSATAILTHWTVWTDLGVPALEFNVYLTGYDLFRVNLQQLLLTGNMPQTASAGQDQFDTISPKGQFSQDINFASCNGQLPLPPIPAPQVAGLQAALTGHASVNYGPNRCGGVNHGDNLARGYITIDVVNNCTARFPGETGYFGSGASGDVTRQNVLIGDSFYLNPAKNHAFSVPLVSLVADATDPALTTSGNYTFYGKYNGFTATDNRQPTSTNFMHRYVKAGSPQGLNYMNQGTQAIVWRDSKINGVTSPLGFTCGTPPSWYPLTQEGIVAFDEQENVQLPNVAHPFPAETQKIPLAGASLPITFAQGLLYLDLNTSVGGQPSNLSDQAAAQAWVLPIYDQGVGGGGNNPTNSWEMGEEATLLDSAEGANHSFPSPLIPPLNE